MGYGGVGQFFPGVVLGLYSKRVTMAGVFAGIVTGVCIFVPLVLMKRDPIMGLNAGFVALCCNFAVVAVVSLLGPAKQPLLNEAATVKGGVEGLEVAPIPAAR
jgi:Na+/proline symporter